MPIRRIRLLALFALGATACAPRAARRGDTVVFASGADLESINPLLTMHPLAHQVQRYALLVTLVQYDSTLTIRPYFARRWDWSPGSTVLTLHLATALRWHDGAPTTAHDVVWTLDAARDPATGYPRAADVASLVADSALDDSTVVLRFRSPQAGIPDVLTDLAILPAHLLQGTPHSALRQAAWNVNPIGNGPFRFVSHEPNRRWVFDANPDFPPPLGGPPLIRRLVIAVVDEPTTKLAALTSGELDFAGIQPAHASFVARDPHLAVITYPLLFTYALIFNTRRPPLNNVRVRRAISAAIDRRAIVQGYLFGFGTPASGPAAFLDGPDSIPPVNRTLASALFAKHPIDVELLSVGSGEAALEQMLQRQLAPLGIRLHIRLLELSTFLARVEGPEHDFDAAVLGMPGDPDLGQVPTLLRIAGVAHNVPRHAMLRIVADSVPAAFLYHANGLQGMNRRVRGVHMDVRGELPTATQWHIAP